MKKKSIVILCLSVVFAVVLNLIAFVDLSSAGVNYGGFEKNIRKGIDLAGGSVITYKASIDNPTSEQMNAVEAIFQTRLNSAGLTEARISKDEGGRVTVEIPATGHDENAEGSDMRDTHTAASVLGNVAKLTFRNAAGETVMDGSAVKKATYQYGKVSNTGIREEHYITIEFTSEGATQFADITKAAAGSFISIYMDEDLLSSPRVDSSYASSGITGGSCVISGGFETKEEAQLLANQINSGNLPFKLDKESEQTVGAELGDDALPRALLAAAIGVLLIIIFMIAMYRVPGLIASLSLLIYVGLIGLAMGILHTNLSLSGIAGIVLSIGMAVDADCIIFERMKEELALGKTIKASVDAGFNKAFSAILDSNVTTIISCVVLYFSGIGTVVGFATTLGIGVILSMFTAIVITKFLLKQLVNIGIKNRSVFYRAAKKGGAE